MIGAGQSDMVIAWVSDEYYVSVADAQVEVVGQGIHAVLRSTPTGAVVANLPPGDYAVAIAHPSFGRLRSRITLPPAKPAQFRLLSDGPWAHVWPKTVRSGERAELRVSSPTGYRAELWFYGAEPTFVAHVGHGEHPASATRQTLPEGDFSGRGVDWNQAGKSIGPGVDASPRLLLAPERSGLYFVHVHTTSGAVVTCPWVVAPAAPENRIAVLVCDMTWNAYNDFGGRSNYVHSGGLGDQPDFDRRLDLPRYLEEGQEEWGHAAYPPLSFDRPDPGNQIPIPVSLTDPILDRTSATLAAADWRLLGWLEANGYPVDVYAESQYARSELDPGDYDVIILATHPEYWTVEMYDRLKVWVHDEGGHLISLGGNAINCAVEVHGDSMVFLNGVSSEMEARRHVIESRFGLVHEPEAHLLGVGYTRAGLLTAAPYAVLEPDHWAFAGTGVQIGTIIGTRNLNTRIPGGASGHETDKLSPSSPAGTMIIARGTNANGGGAEIGTYESDSGGAVFAVGSINFNLSLPVDDVLARMLSNVLGRFLARTEP